jgi:hypothetical protein
MFENLAMLVVDLGYYNLKCINRKGIIRILKNAHTTSSQGNSVVPLDEKTRQVTLEILDPLYGVIKVTRTYGQNIAQLSGHVQGISSRKVEEIRFAFAALLSKEQHDKKLNIFCIHNESKDFSRIQTALIGKYKVTINGEDIECEVVSCNCLHEGLGTYHDLKKTHELPGSTRILDLGFGLANDAVISGTGDIEYYSTKPELSMFTMAKFIENSETFQTYMATSSCSLLSIAYALEKDKPLGSMPAREWELLKRYSVQEYFKTLKSYLTSPIANAGFFVNTYVLTGGGAAILARENPAFKKVFTIPKEPATASLIGILDHNDIKNSRG